MPVCLFDECWLGLVENETVRDLTSVLDKLPSRRYPFPHGDVDLLSPVAIPSRRWAACELPRAPR
jgi:hypothetical protein